MQFVTRPYAISRNSKYVIRYKFFIISNLRILLPCFDNIKVGINIENTKRKKTEKRRGIFEKTKNTSIYQLILIQFVNLKKKQHLGWKRFLIFSFYGKATKKKRKKNQKNMEL